MTNRTIELSRLRAIGWAFWDPIGLFDVRQDCEDEYDTYLSEVADMIRAGGSLSDAAAYLLSGESEWMGLPQSNSAKMRAMATVQAIQAYLSALDA